MEKPKEEFSLFGYYYGIDLTYIVLVLPAILLGLWAQMRVKSTYARYSQVRASRGVTADQVARLILDMNGGTSPSSGSPAPSPTTMTPGTG